jgi:hypothetical protein
LAPMSLSAWRSSCATLARDLVPGGCTGLGATQRSKASVAVCSTLPVVVIGAVHP